MAKSKSKQPHEFNLAESAQEYCIEIGQGIQKLMAADDRFESDSLTVEIKTMEDKKYLTFSHRAHFVGVEFKNRPVEARLIPEVFHLLAQQVRRTCQRCEERMIEESDYLCYECRHGTLSS